MVQIIYLLETQQNSSFFNPEIWLTFLVTFLSALLIWLLKVNFDKFEKESIALNELQFALALNVEKLKDNKSFFGDWLSALEKKRTYSVSFHNLVFPYEKLKDIRSSKLINQTLAIFYKCESFGKDLKSLHKSYYDISVSGKFKGTEDPNWIIFNENTYSSVKKNEVSFTTINAGILDTLTETRKYIGVRKKSYYYTIMKLFKDKSVKRYEKKTDSDN